MNWLKKLFTRKKPEPAPIPESPTTKDGEKLNSWEAKSIQQTGLCPDCGSPLLEGPHGGLSVNVYCSGRFCGSRFNEMGPFGVERITDARPKATQA